MQFENQYLTYEEYVSLGGNLDEVPFNLLEFKARKEIDKYTFGRLIELDEQTQAVKLCVYELINELNSYQTSNNIASESVDGYSVSYSSSSNSEQRQEIYNIVFGYLVNEQLENGMPYLYRGGE